MQNKINNDEILKLLKESGFPKETYRSLIYYSGAYDIEEPTVHLQEFVNKIYNKAIEKENVIEELKRRDLVQLSKLIRKYLKEMPYSNPNELCREVISKLMKDSKGQLDYNLLISMIRYETGTDS